MIRTTTDSLSWSADAAGMILSLRTPEARRIAESLQPGKTYTVEIKEEKRKRSLDANAYAWVLIDKIAAAMHLGKDEVYRDAIRNIGGNNEIVCVQEDALDKLKSCWEAHGLGWQVLTMPSKIKGCVNAMLICGSSSFDPEQMSIFIDRLIQDAQALGIETMPPERLAGMLEAWDGK